MTSRFKNLLIYFCLLLILLTGCGIRERKFEMERSGNNHVIVRANSRGRFTVQNDTRTIEIDTKQKGYLEQFKDIIFLRYASEQN